MCVLRIHENSSCNLFLKGSGTLRRNILTQKLQAESEVVYPPPTPESPPTPEPEPATEARVPSSPPPAEQESAAADESDKMTDDPGTVQDQGMPASFLWSTNCDCPKDAKLWGVWSKIHKSVKLRNSQL